MTKYNQIHKLNVIALQACADKFYASSASSYAASASAYASASASSASSYASSYAASASAYASASSYASASASASASSASYRDGCNKYFEGAEKVMFEILNPLIKGVCKYL